MKITQGKITRAQRIVLYGVESVGKTTFAAKFPNPLFLDVEGGTAHLDVPRAEIGSWNELTQAITECHKLDYQTIVIDSIDWSERLCIEAFLAENKKESIESIPYGKGWIQVAEKMSRFLTSLDGLIDAGKNVVLIGHSQIKRVEPPDLMSAYDRFELKLAKQTSPLVKEWADELWFARFETKVVESDNGKAKGVGGKTRIILTTHAAAYDAKTRSGLDDKIPLDFASVGHLFNGKPVEVKAASDATRTALEANEDTVNAFLLMRKVIAPGQTWRDCDPGYLLKVEERLEQFLKTASAGLIVKEAA
jgi:hypothetical protein